MAKLIESAFEEKDTYTKDEALIRMIALGDTMSIASSIDDIWYYYLDGKFYRSGEGEWNPNESSNDVEWIVRID